MPSTYTGSGIELIGDGEQSGSWGNTTNVNLQIINRLVSEAGSIALSGTTHTLTIADGSLSDGQYGVLVFGGSPSGTNTVTVSPNDAKRVFIVKNATAQSVVLTQGSGGNVTIPASAFKIVYTDGGGAGAAVVDVTSVAAFTTVNATTLDTTNIEVTNIKAKDGTAAGSIADATGVVTLASSVLTTTDINGGTIDGVTIGGASAGAGTFTTLTTTGNVTLGNAATDTVTITADVASNILPSADNTYDLGGVGAEWKDLYIDGTANIDSLVADTADINGGTIDGTVIGGSTPAAISGTTGSFSGDVSIADKIVHTGDTNTAIRFPAADTVTVETAGSERVRVDASGNVGIGTSSPGTKLDVSGNLRFSAANPVIEFNNGGAQVYSTVANTLQFATGGGIGSPTERMRIDSSGNLLVGKTNTTPTTVGVELASNGVVKAASTADAGEFYRSTASGGNGVILTFSDVGGTRNLVGAGFANGTFGAVSDASKKKNIEDARGYLDDLMQIRVVKYNWTTDEDTAPKELGWIAQEVEQVFPGMVTEMQGNKLLKKEVFVPMLLKAMQEQQAIIEALEARITALEGTSA
jgi:hypothetical protein